MKSEIYQKLDDLDSQLSVVKSYILNDDGQIPAAFHLGKATYMLDIILNELEEKDNNKEEET